MYKKGKGQKEKAQFLHAQRRALQRYDICFNKEVKELILNKIMNGDGKFFVKQSNRITLWDIEIEQQTVRVVYDKQRKNIVSFLPILE